MITSHLLKSDSLDHSEGFFSSFMWLWGRGGDGERETGEVAFVRGGVCVTAGSDPSTGAFLLAQPRTESCKPARGSGKPSPHSLLLRSGPSQQYQQTGEAACLYICHGNQKHQH